MKAERIKIEFHPVSLILETQEEVNQLWAILNHAKITAGTSFDCENPMDRFSTTPDRHHEFDKLCKRLHGS